MTIHISFLMLAFAGGMGIGLFYFGGLWWTVQRFCYSHRPWLLTLGSFLVRSCLSLTGFYIIMGGRWERLLAGLLGFILLRLFLVKHLKPVMTKHSIR